MNPHQWNEDENATIDDAFIEKLLASSPVEIQLEPSDKFYSRMQHAPWRQDPDERHKDSRSYPMARLSSIGFITAIAATILIVALLIAFTPIGVYAKGLINYLLRANSNELMVTLTVPPEYPSIGNRSPASANLSVEEVEILAGFKPILPNVLPVYYQFSGANYDSRLEVIELYYEGSDDWFMITQKKGRIDYQRIGASATIHLVPIGDVVGEYVPGGWSVAIDENNIIKTAIPGSEVSLNVYWDSQLRQNMLRWQKGDILIEILSFSDQLDVEALVNIAESMSDTP